jgi:flagellar hook-basal body complex protein FliE
MAITSIGASNPLSVPGAPSNGAAAEGGDFGSSLAKLLESVESSASDANSAVAAMTDGSGDVHTAMLALQRAEISMQLTVQVRNKLVQAYQDLMRMPI